ncbi:Hypothetical protein R9X50_00380100 [Acrodontium crateriforme]|uniref:Uncharacterized protein n=1 Tax=Acrodontium crateriforme TaxID=150365 RepID=A0AAQ3M4V0_9PEZI|nr:Hypothetical protein R9X50_00380100 [Acrodontium crateriforme]
MFRLQISDLRRLVIVLSSGVFAILTLSYLLSATLISKNDRMGSIPTTSDFKFEVVPGVFWQSEEGTNPDEFDYTKTNFGLIDRTYESDNDSSTGEQWQRFQAFVEHLNKASPPIVLYKVIYLGRHGEGYHNVAEAHYGTKEWDVYWSKLDGDGTSFWSDAHLTPIGEGQALEAHAFMEKQLTLAKMPAPCSYVVSPLYRCIQTANLTWTNLELPIDKPFRPVIKELIREVLGEHTCDRRSSKSFIQKSVPTWTIEDGFTENDELWQADHRETDAEHDVRSTSLLNDVFSNENSGAFMSFTAHSGTIASLLRVIGHQKFKLQTGGLLPVLVKATRH